MTVSPEITRPVKESIHLYVIYTILILCLVGAVLVQHSIIFIVEL